jgi:uncharacterized membrane protein (UPF0127 family)
MPPTTRRFSVINSTRGTTLATRADLANNFWTRFVGLMFRRRLEAGRGLYLERSASIHAFFMFFRFDAVFLDREDRVTKVVHAMRPWTVAFGGRGAKHVLELPAGVARATGTEPGDELRFAAAA